MNVNITQTILIIDELDSNIALLSKLLDPLNVNILTASNGKDGLREVNSHDVDLLFIY
jgi:CheY-like chemotaxis protein